MAIAECLRELLLIEQHCQPQPDGSIIAGPFTFCGARLLLGSSAAVCIVVEDECYVKTQLDNAEYEIREMLKLSIHLPMTNDQLHSSSNAEISIREKRHTPTHGPTQGGMDYAQAGFHDSGGGDDGNLLGVESSGESHERGR